MKRLTAVTAVLAGVGAAAGIFGMSEAFNAGGFWVAVGIVIAVASPPSPTFEGST